MYPDADGPWFLPAFTATCCLLAVCVLSYATLPAVLLWEAKSRKRKYGHAMPLRAMEDAAQSDAAIVQLERFQGLGKGDKEGVAHVERV